MISRLGLIFAMCGYLTGLYRAAARFFQCLAAAALRRAGSAHLPQDNRRHKWNRSCEGFDGYLRLEWHEDAAHQSVESLLIISDSGHCHCRADPDFTPGYSLIRVSGQRRNFSATTKFNVRGDGSLPVPLCASPSSKPTDGWFRFGTLLDEAGKGRDGHEH